MTTPRRLPAVVPLDRDDDPIVNWTRGYAAALEVVSLGMPKEKRVHLRQAQGMRDAYGWARFEHPTLIRPKPAKPQCQCSYCRSDRAVEALGKIPF